MTPDIVRHNKQEAQAKDNIQSINIFCKISVISFLYPEQESEKYEKLPDHKRKTGERTVRTF